MARCCCISLLHLTGYDLSLDEIKHFRQWESKTPGHPEYGLTPGVETTTGPLGQGFANGVGMAIAERHLAAVFNRPGHEIIEHYVYAIVTDGDLMEGVASEAASLAGHLRLGKLIYLYDDNRISIEGSTELAFTEDRAARFIAYGWQVLKVDDGNNYRYRGCRHSGSQKRSSPEPDCLPDTYRLWLAHPAGYGEGARRSRRVTKSSTARRSSWVGRSNRASSSRMTYSAFFRQALAQGATRETEWRGKVTAYRAAYPDLAAELVRRLNGELADRDGTQACRYFPPDAKGIATRVASGKVLNALAARLPELMGGSADLAPSTNTWLTDYPDFRRRPVRRAQPAFWRPRARHGRRGERTWPTTAG